MDSELLRMQFIFWHSIIIPYISFYVIPCFEAEGAPTSTLDQHPRQGMFRVLKSSNQHLHFPGPFAIGPRIWEIENGFEPGFQLRWQWVLRQPQKGFWGWVNGQGIRTSTVCHGNQRETWGTHRHKHRWGKEWAPFQPCEGQSCRAEHQLFLKHQVRTSKWDHRLLWQKPDDQLQKPDMENQEVLQFPKTWRDSAEAMPLLGRILTTVHDEGKHCVRNFPYIFKLLLAIKCTMTLISRYIYSASPEVPSQCKSNIWTLLCILGSILISKCP